MPDLSQLNLNEDAAPQVDWEAPEAGRTPPPVFPGLYTLRFKMPENHDDWFDAVERATQRDAQGKPVDSSKRKFLELTYEPEVIANSQDQPIAGPEGEVLKLGPQRANTYMSPKMHIHQLAELLRAMGVRIEGSIVQQIDDVCKQLDGKATFKAEIIWRAYFKSTDTTISTHPRGKKSGELLWPRDAAGNPELLCKNPSTGETAYGYAEVARVKLPTAASNPTETLASAAT
jgi:hypothetical protein